jgi:Ni/Co efflux regulator RcnB
MPAEYRSNQYVVAAWRAKHPRQPPRGYRWVRSDNGDFLMIAIASIFASR